jgi:hypothetical protein
MVSSSYNDPRDAAIQRHNERAARQQQATAEQERQREAAAVRDERNAATWPTAFNAISLGVTNANNYFAQRDTPYVISQYPNTAVPYSASYEIKPSGKLDRAALFTFAMDDDGLVQITTDAYGVADLPHAVPVADATASWAQKAADQVMIAVLDGQRMRIED